MPTTVHRIIVDMRFRATVPTHYRGYDVPRYLPSRRPSFFGRRHIVISTFRPHTFLAEERSRRNGATLGHPGARLRSIVAGLALLAFSRAWLARTALHCINLVQCVVRRVAGIASAEKKLRKQALLIPLGVVHAPRPLLAVSRYLSLSFSLPLSRSLPPPHSSLFRSLSRTRESPTSESALLERIYTRLRCVPTPRACERALLFELHQTSARSRCTEPATSSRKKTLENLGRPRRHCAARSSSLMASNAGEV